MLTEDYVSYGVAKLLKEKGFDIPCKYAWHGGIKYPDFHRHSRNFNGGDYKDLRTKWYSAPTHQMAMKWLRGNNIIIIPQPEYFSCDKCESWGIDIWAGDNYEKSLRGFPTYEEAVEAALKYSLENLI